MTLHECVRSAELQIQDMRRSLDERENQLHHAQREIASLNKQLEIALTEASNQKFFREQDMQAHDKVLFGYSMAIQSMVAALKGGN